MINDPSINVYEVVAEAESYFQNIDKNAKGSGWKAYNRWLYENEPKFYPSGDRSYVDPFFVSKEYLKNKDIEEGSTQIFLLNRCSAIYAYASAILLNTDPVNSKNFIEIANNLLFKSVELMVIDEKEKLEEAQKKAEKKRKKLFDIYIGDGKKNWEKNKSHFKGCLLYTSPSPRDS